MIRDELTGGEGESMDSDVDAIVLVGGKGTRLRPLTETLPKPMLPIAGVPYLTHLLSRIRSAGVRHVIMGTSYKAEVFSEYYGDGSQLGLELEYVVEETPLGTGGAIGNVASLLRGDAALIFNGDILTGCDLTDLLATHRRTGADVSLHLTRVDDPRAFGCVPTEADGRVTAFLEKDPNPVTDQINAGTYVFNRSVIESIPTDRPVSVERETFPGLLESGALVVGHVDATYWRDLGKPSDFVTGSADLVRGIAPSDALPGPVGDALVLAGGTVADSARVTGGSVVDAGCEVAAGAVVDGSVLLPGARVAAGAVVRDSIVGRDAVIGKDSVLADAVIGDGVEIGARVELLHGIRVWPGTVIADGSVRFSADC
ncbi:MAG TPA: NDP-sugar synthase [Jatrophihabitans sp.]|nr:NDP-sugar synthase [Jatrophihabitans sp.]